MTSPHSPILSWVTILFFSIGITYQAWSFNTPNDALVSGVDIIEFPEKNQLYPRNLSTNQATITVSGTVQDYSGYEQMRVEIYRDGELHNTIDQDLDYDGDEADFYINFNITAELKDYGVTLYGIENGDDKFEATAQNIVAGDVFMINGQSNALAGGNHHPDDFSPFVRSYSSNGNWVPMNQFFPGEWGGRLAKEIVDTHNIPVAIFNEAEGGQAIAYFLKDTSSPDDTNYDNLYNRLDAAGVKDNIRAAIWYQGESDGWDLSIEEYKTAFTELYNDWNVDYTVEHYYLFQLVGFGCNYPQPYIFEAHRQLANELPNLQIMSSNNTSAHDGCHFDYYGGYEVLGNRIYDLTAKDLYNQSSYEVRAGDIAGASLIGDEIVIEMEDIEALNVIGSPWVDFDLGFANAWVTGGYVSGTNIHLEIAGDINTVYSVSYYGHSGTANDWITNTTGVGILLWYNFPVEGGSQENNEPNCSDVVAYTTSNTLVLEAINEGPIVKISIFNDNWNEIFSCTNDCNDTETFTLSEGQYRVLIRLYNYDWSLICEESRDLIVGGDNTETDNDNDGIPQGEDCDDNDPDLPAPVGSACNDGNSNTTNDVIQSDGCTCEGTIIDTGEVDCDAINIVTTNTGITISNLDQSPISKIQVFDSDWSSVYSCNNCGAAQSISLSADSYYVKVSLYDGDWNQLCSRNENIDLTEEEEEEEGDCTDVTITISSGQVDVSGLGFAAISKIKIYDSNWSLVFSCTGDCDELENVSLPDGEYIIDITLYDIDWKKLCDIREDVIVTGDGNEEPPSDGVDLALDLTTNLTEFEQYEPVVYTLTLENEGSAQATNIQVEFPLPEGTAYTTHNSSEGTYSSWDGLWHVDQLEAGESVILQLTAFVVTEENSLFAFAQVYALSETDTDSSPNNNNSGVPAEDDEVASNLSAQDRSNHHPIGIDLGQNRFLTVERIYPVPTYDIVNLQIVTNTNSTLPVQLYNSAGVLKKVFYFEINKGFNQLRLEVANLPSGIYTLLVQSGNSHAPIRFVKIQ